MECGLQPLASASRKTCEKIRLCLWSGGEDDYLLGDGTPLGLEKITDIISTSGTQFHGNILLNEHNKSPAVLVVL